MNSFRKLNTIQWFNGSNSRNIIFKNTSYFDSECSENSDCYRLKLDGVVELSAGDTKEHSFEYYPGVVPEKGSYDQDHWGYYNGALNTTAVPSFTFYLRPLGGNADREPNFETSLIGMLKKVIYPTKGTTTFTYEQNTYEDDTNEDDVRVSLGTSTLDVTGTATIGEICRSSDLLVSSSKFNTDYRLKYTCHPIFSGLDGVPEGGRYPVFTVLEYNTSNVLTEFTINDDITGVIDLPPGKTYTFRVCASGSDVQVVVDLEADEVDRNLLGRPIARATGGLRLGTLQNWDPVANITQTRTFDYGFGGYRVWKNPYYAKFTISIAIDALFGTINNSSLAISSTSIGGLGPASMPVAYQKVTEWLGTPSSNIGRIETNFIPAIDLDASLKPQESKHSTRILVDFENYYDEDNQLVRAIDNNYNAKTLSTIIGFNAEPVVQYSNGMPALSDYEYRNNFNYINFRLYSSWNQLASIITTNYDGNESLRTQVTYEYDEENLHANPVAEININSKGEEVKTQFKYPIDNFIPASDCFNEYMTDLTACDAYVVKHAIEVSQCKQIWDQVQRKRRTCEAFWDDRTYEKCKSSFGYSIPCAIRMDRLNNCSEAAQDELEALGYYSCLENISNEFPGCQKAAFMNYMSCQEQTYYQMGDEYYNASNSADKAVALLNLSNIQSSPLEVTSFIDEQESTKMINEFDTWVFTRSDSLDTIALLKSKSISYKKTTPETLITVNEYDEKGNPLEVTDHKAGYVKSYIWGYNNTHLIAEVINATYSQVEPITLDYYEELQNPKPSDNDILNFLTSLRNHPDLNEAIVTGYVHHPGVGMTYMVDPNGLQSSYSYDKLGRLIEVRDNNNNLLQSYDYNYADGGIK